MNLVTVLLVVLVVLLVLGGLPPVQAWHGYGYYPSGGLGIVLVILLILLLLGRL